MPKYEGYYCGYCKGNNTNHSTGMWAHCLLVNDYQELIDRGWRRSGQYCYKPKMTVTCCPLYTIRCDAANFKLSKSQKKVLKRISKFLRDGSRSSRCDSEEKGGLDSPGSELKEVPMIDNVQGINILETANLKVEKIIPRTRCDVTKNEEKSETTNVAVGKLLLDESDDDEPSSFAKLGPNVGKPSLIKLPRKGVGMDSSKPQCKKAKLIRLEKRLMKLKQIQASKDDEPIRHSSGEKSLEEFIRESANENFPNQLELKLVRCSPQSVEFTETFDVSHSLYQKYQAKIHNDSPMKCSKEQFKRFLVHSPLRAEERSVEGTDDTIGYGSFHQQYWLNGKLIAVGVIDILPKCVSSVYFYYDPDYAFLSLGTYSSLREIEMVRSLTNLDPELQYYYMGFYIHSCPKMRYKAKFLPSFLLCPETYTWNSVEKSKPKLDVSKYARLNEDIRAENDNTIINLGDVLVLWRNVAMTQETYKHKSRANDDSQVMEYAQRVGRRAAESMLLYRP
ncbi:Golgi SNAP receptor complex member 1 [Nesidiocoris tenuis]|uniref:Arginyl-tRNA--protein transferase 1 n=1 Tax=Nesidiocoris tenuis TaxID=355587 RepID=A0ABN7A9L2_9HEMI|nr:Golgi SNAP receptor complex member 1 [Nesidiocoris tenuis]